MLQTFFSRVLPFFLTLPFVLCLLTSFSFKTFLVFDLFLSFYCDFLNVDCWGYPGYSFFSLFACFCSSKKA